MRGVGVGVGIGIGGGERTNEAQEEARLGLGEGGGGGTRLVRQVLGWQCTCSAAQRRPDGIEGGS